MVVYHTSVELLLTIIFPIISNVIFANALQCQTFQLFGIHYRCVVTTYTHNAVQKLRNRSLKIETAKQIR